MKISIDGKYKTVSGREVKIYSTDNGGVYPVHGAVKLIDGWRVDAWTMEGRYNNLNSVESYLDLVLDNPYLDYKVDDKVIATNFDGKEYHAYFCKFEIFDNEFVPYVFGFGQSSWTTGTGGAFSAKSVRRPDGHK